MNTNVVRVLLFLLPDLDPVEFRPVRQSYVAEALALPQSRVSGALARLVLGGILEETDRRAQLADRAFVKQYRLNARHPDCARFLAFTRGDLRVPPREEEFRQHTSDFLL